MSTHSTPAQDVAAAGVSIDAVTLVRCTFIDRYFHEAIAGRASEPGPRQETGPIDLSARVAVLIDEDKSTALVRLLVSVAPRHQPTWSADVELIGQYSAGSDPVLPLEQFAWNNGIAYLIPYVRQRLASLTSESIYPTYLLPPISVATLLENADHSQTAEWPVSGT